MGNMAQEPDAPAGMSRRDVLRRGAFVGGAGAVAWAAPTIATLGPRAFAQTGTEEPGGPGLVSWIMVWFQCGTNYHRVKYEGGATGYSQDCTADKGNISSDGAEGASYYDVEQARVGNLTYVASCPPDVSVASADGLLRVTVDGDCTILGWVLHDGSCGNPTDGQPTYPRFRSLANPYKIDGDASSGTVGPVGDELESGGPFQWDKCK
jgi:hypothetical protein